MTFDLQKLGKRLRSLEKKDWTTERKAKVVEAMKMEYMSSEESEHESEPPHKTKQYIVGPLTCQSNELKRFKRRLDKGHLESLPELIRKRTLPRSVEAPSSRGIPDNCPEWASNQCLNSSVSSTPPSSSTPLSGNSLNEEQSISPSSCRNILQE